MIVERKTFDWNSFLKELAVIAVPVAMQNLLTTTGSMIDTIMIAPLGENTVGAIGLCAQFSSLLFSGYWGFIGGGMLFFAQYYGAKDDDGINRSYGTTLIFLLLVSCLAAFLAIVHPDMVMRLYTDKENLQEIGVRYLRVIGFAYPLTTLSVGMSALLRSTERVRIPLAASVASVATNVCLNWIFIYGKFGCPAMGVAGAALGTVFAGLVNILMILTLARLKGFPYLFQVRKHFGWSRAWLAEYMRKCFPIICNEVLLGLGNMVINVVLGRQSEEVIAAVAVFRTLEGLVIGFFAGFSNAASILVGKRVGAGELNAAYEHAKRLVFTCGGCILVVCLILLAAHRPILTLMGLSGGSYRYGTGILLIYSVVAVIRMCNWIQNDTYRSAGDAAYGTILEITFMYIVVLPAVWLTGLVWHAPFFVIFLCCYVDEPIRLCLMQRHMYSGRWVKPVTQQGKAALPAFRARWKKNS